MSTRPLFTSRLTMLLTMAGLAIGLGNVWRFPYMMGQYGGSAFLVIYLIFMLLLAVPALMAEWALGRSTRSSSVGAFRRVFGRGPGLAVGLLLGFAVFMALCYYSLVIGNVVYSAVFAIGTGFSGESLAEYQAGLGQRGMQYLYGLLVIAAGLWVVDRGLIRGIEKANRWLVPLFGLSAIYLVFVALSLDGAMDQVRGFLKPDFSRVDASTWFAAMGQACFSMGLSGVLAVMYGSYLREQTPLAPNALWTGALDVGAALLASLFVVPAVLVFGLDMAAGPGLLFNTLPELFTAMPGGRWLAGVFLASWVLVALLTVIGASDSLVGVLEDFEGQRLSRRQLVWSLGGVAALVLAPIAWRPQVIGLLDLVFGSGLFMLGALLAVIGAGWGLGRALLHEQVAPGLPAWLAGLLVVWMRWVVPLALAAILIGFIWQQVAA